MTDREELVELMKQGDCNPMTLEDCYGCKYDDEHDCQYRLIADYLLAHGVTVQKTGRWVDKPTGRYGQMQSWCSACGQHSGIGGIESNRHKDFCPNCGAKMEC